MENQFDNQATAQTSGSEASGSLLDKATSILGNVDFNKIPDSVKQYGTTAAAKVKGLSTTQKVIGGALIAIGAAYLSKRSKGSWSANAAHSSRKA